MCPIRSPASDGLLTLFGITSDMKLSQNLYLTLIEVRHPMERLVSAYRHVFERQQGYEDQLIKMASMREVGISSGDNGVLTGIMWQVLGDKFSQMSWPTFVDMIINNGVFSHPELGNHDCFSLWNQNLESPNFSEFEHSQQFPG